MSTPLLSTVAFILLTSMGARADSYTYPQLVERLTDLGQLAKLPPDGEKTALASSYDRRSQYDAAQDKYLAWDANDDGRGLLSKDGDESVLADIQGPGCITRIWSATAQSGHVKIYLDGASIPTIDLPFIDYFSGKAEPFNRPNLVYRLNDTPGGPPGFNNFTPIPFAKSCRIVADPGWGNYYQFTYTTFPAGTVVPTFQMTLAKEDAAALDNANTILGQCGQYPGAAQPPGKTETSTIKIDAGKEAVVADLIGPQAVTAFKVKLDLPANPEAARVLLRQLTVSMTWDDDTAPAVWSPLGDFFAYVGGAKPFNSLPLGLGEDGTFYCYWYMPFARKAHLVIGNDSPGPVSLDCQVSHAPLNLPADKLARFHAKWHRDAFLPEREDRHPDWTLLTTQGRGRYVGTHLHGWNPEGSWWGEGDDKFFVDGEKFPSTFGTGSEDYFGYAWSSEKLFSRPYHNQILNEDNAGHFDDNRWHIADSVPFQTSFDAILEKYYSNTKGTLYAAEAYWYLDAAGKDAYTAVPVTERTGYWNALVDANGKLEGEWLFNMNYPNPYPEIQKMQEWGDGWSGGKQLFWKAHDKASLDIPITLVTGGNFHVYLRCTKAPDYGIFQFRLDSDTESDPVDLFAPAVTPGDEIDLGTHELKPGVNRLVIRVKGKSDSSTGYFFGLDYIKLVPAN